MFGSNGKRMLAVFVVVYSLSGPVFAAETDLDRAISEQKAALAKLTAQKQQIELEEQTKQQKELAQTVKWLEEQQEKQRKVQESISGTLESIQKFLVDQNGNGSSSAELMQTLVSIKEQQMSQQAALQELQDALSQGAFNAELKAEQDRQRQVQLQINETLAVIQHTLERYQHSVYAPAVTSAVTITPATSNTPGLNNTQDAVGAERDGEMIFSYIEGGIYKIYCKVGFLTDIRFRKGEKITFVGGGDPSKWSIDTANTGSGYDSVAHLYIKPLKKEAITNLIINTDKHTYQIIITSADWYNPMVTWSYGIENELNNKIQKQKDEALFVERNLSVSPELMNYNYKITDRGYSWAPKIVCDDGVKTFIVMPENVRQGNMPVMFIREKGKRSKLALVNYRIKNNLFVVDRLFDEAELRINEKEFVRITNRK